MCDEFRPVWEALETESVAHPFHRIGKFLYYGVLLCVPSGFRESIIHHCHESTGHKGFRPLLGREDGVLLGQRDLRGQGMDKFEVLTMLRIQVHRG